MAQLFKTAFLIRECCHLLVSATNIPWAITILYKYCNKCTWNKYCGYQFKCSLSICIIYILSTFSQSVITHYLYISIFYNPHQNGNHWQTADTADEAFVAFNKILIVLFYIHYVRETKIINQTYATMLSVVLPIIFAGLAFAYIYLQHFHAEQHNVSGADFVQCDNEWTNIWAKTTAFMFTILESMCVMTFISALTFKLGQISVNTNRKGSIDDNLYAKVKKAITLTVVQHLLSCIIIMTPRLIDGTPLKWIYPLDYVVNSWCLCLMCAQIEWWNKLECCGLKKYDDTVIFTKSDSWNRSESPDSDSTSCYSHVKSMEQMEQIEQIELNATYPWEMPGIPDDLQTFVQLKI